MPQVKKSVDDHIPASVVKTYADEIFKHFRNDFEGCALGYQWPAPPKKPNGCLETIDILQKFTESWQGHPSNREKVAVAVLRWGGIYNVKPSKPGEPNKPSWNRISLLIKATDGTNYQKQYERLIHSEFGNDDPKDSRMSSWTKVISIGNPRQFFIYDSRVAYALNQLCSMALKKGQLPYFFPWSQAKKDERNAGQKALVAGFADNVQRFPSTRGFYFDFYCKLIKAVAERFYSELDLQKVRAVFTPNGTSEEEEKFHHETLPHLVEMALFMYGK